MNDTIRRYQENLITGFVESVQPVVVESASGAVIRDVSGREYIDCFAGISVVNAGHCNPMVNAAAKAQIDKLVHCGSYIYHSAPTAELAERLAGLMPGDRLKKSFFACTGAEAVEGALKVARLSTGRHEVISLQASFHGRTWGTLSVTGNSGRKKRGGPYAPGVAFAPAPYAYRAPFACSPEEFGTYCARAVEDTIRFSTSGDVAALIAEPVMGEGGIIIPPRNYFRELKQVLDQHGILFIADEVQSGFGRTGRMFAVEHYGIEPDIMVTAKGIANGFPLSAFTTGDEIAAAFRPGDHLSTFGGNPVCCAAALANIRYFEQENLCARSTERGEQALSRLRSAQRSIPLIGDVRGIGLMVGIELVRDASLTPASAEAGAVRRMCLERGVLVGVGGVYGNVIRLQPPLVITAEQLDFALGVLEDAISEAGRHVLATAS